MINNRRNVSAYEGPLPRSLRPTRRERFIDGPIYDSAHVLRICEAQNLYFWTRASGKNAQHWGINTTDLCEMIAQAVQTGKYENSQWCAQSDDLCGAWAACDSYEIIHPLFDYDKLNYVETKFYLKFAISKTGKALLAISNHPEGT